MLAVLFDYRLYHAPLVLSPTTSAAHDNISTPFRVLDIGCGTGIWAMDFAEAWPRVMVNGIGKCGRRGPPHVLDSADPSCNDRPQPHSAILGSTELFFQYR